MNVVTSRGEEGVSTSSAAERFVAAERALWTKHGLSPRSRRLDVDGRTLRVLELGDDAGAGEPIVFVHGGGAFASVYASLIAALAPRMPARRFVLIDRPGCGLSDPFDYSALRPTARQPTALRQHAVRTVAGALDALSIERADIVANCAGGLFALSFMLAQPQRVRRAAFVGAAAGLDRWLPAMARVLGRRGLSHLLFATAFRPGARSTLETYRRLFIGDERKLEPELLAAAEAAMSLPGAVMSFLTLMHAMTDWGGARPALVLERDAMAITAPTLFVTGSKSVFERPGHSAAVARSMPAAHVDVLEGAGHFTWLDDPAAVAERIANHLLQQ